MAASKGTWIGGTVFAAAVVAAATWFGAVSPTLTATAEVRSQTDQVNASNAVLQKKIDQLAKDYAKLPQYKQQLADLRKQVPTAAELSDYLRQLDQIATARSVVLVNVTPGSAKPITSAPGAGAAAAPAATPTPTPSATTSAATNASAANASAEDGPATPAPAAAPSGVPAGLTAIPIAIDVIGTYDNTLAFLNDVQTATPRLFLAYALNGTSLTDAAAGSGRPQVHKGDQELVLTGYLYALPDTTTVVPAPTASPSAPALPAPVPGKNPLMPISGR